MNKQLYFAHANSFPGSMYRKMFNTLAGHYDISYIDCVGHQPQFPVTDCWPYLVAETIDYIERHCQPPVLGVGHSLGGVLVLYAAVIKPELFYRLILLDSPLFSPWRAHMIWLAKKIGLIHRFTPGGNPLKRRDCWTNIQMVYEYFARKPVFSRFDPECLMDYATYGTKLTEQGIRSLTFRPAIEHAIYITLPHNLKHCVGKITVPTFYLAGTQSNILHTHDRTHLIKHLQIRIDYQNGSHLYPFEHPIETAKHILNIDNPSSSP